MKIINQDFILDGIDKEILRYLTENARTPILEIARNMGASGASIHQRVRKLEDAGIISGSYVRSMRKNSATPLMLLLAYIWTRLLTIEKQWQC